MSAIDPRSHGLDLSRGVPPRKQRILAPSLIDVVDGGMASRQCVCSVRVTDSVNLVLYYVPMASTMVTALRKQLEQYDPTHTQGTKDEGDAV